MMTKSLQAQGFLLLRALAPLYHQIAFVAVDDLEDLFLGAGFGDFEYKIDVDPKNRRVAAASFAAKAETPRQNRLTLKVRFFDVNGDFSVELPENAVPVRGTD